MSVDEQAALQEFDRLIGTEPEEAESTSEPTVSETPEPEAAPDRSRDEQGRFVAETEVADPDLSAYLERYGGDSAAVAKRAMELERERGRLGQELGDQRRIVEELQALRQDLSQPQAGEYALDEEMTDWISENPSNAFAWAQQNNQPHIAERAFAEWKDTDPYSAAVWTNQQQMREFAQHVQTQQAPLQATYESQQLGGIMAELAATYPEFRDHAFVDTLVDQAPEAWQSLRGAIATGTPQEKRAALVALAHVGRGLRAGAPPSTDVNANGLPVAAPFAPAGPDKALAAVVSPAYSPARGAPSAHDRHMEVFDKLIGFSPDEPQ